LRRLDRRHRRLPVRSPGDGQRRDRGSRVPLPRRGRRDGHRSRRADRRDAVARSTARARARGPGLQGRDVRSRGRLTERKTNMAYRLGVDVGGTFTDLFLVSEGNGGAQFRVKTPSTPDDPSEGVLTGVRRICDEAGIGVGELQNILHGTTVATNAVLESKGARVGLITTEGFGQILHLARSQTPGPLAGWIIMIKPDPPASLADTREAVERLDARGNVVVA